MAKQFLSLDDQPTNAAIELIDSDGRAVVVPLMTAAQINALVLGTGTYANQPLVWDGAAWIPCAGAVAAQQFTGEDNTVNISMPTPVPGFPTRCSWTVETANMLDVERDNTLNRRRWAFVGATLNPIEMIAPDVGDPLIGFLGAAPVVRQVLTASLADPQAQINDIVTALVNLGLVTDSRVP